MEGAFQRLTVKHDPWQLCSSHCVQQPGYLSRSLTGPNWWMVNRPLLGMRQAGKWSPAVLRGSAESERQRPLPSMSSCSRCLRKASEPFVFVNCGLKCFSGRPKRGIPLPGMGFSYIILAKWEADIMKLLSIVETAVMDSWPP